jgi:hypothetical protein
VQLTLRRVLLALTDADGTGALRLVIDGIGALWTRGVDCSAAPVPITSPAEGAIATALANLKGAPASSIVSGFRVVAAAGGGAAGAYTVVDALGNSQVIHCECGDGYFFPIKDVSGPGAILVFY